MAVSLVSTGVTFPDGSIQTTRASQAPAFTNRIINGAMVIDQRNAGAALTINSGAAQYPVDRFLAQGQSADGVFTVQQSSVAPSGFSNSLLATVTTADASIGASQFYFLTHRIEGYNVADLGWGAVGASAVTLSFWVRSSLTGTFGGSLMNSAENRSYPFTYTISAADTWEQKSVTISGDTTGTWLKTNGLGCRIYWSIGAGSTLSGTSGAWSGSTLISATGATNLMATSGATFYITGVQLEKGSTATSFDYRPYSAELALCQRYCEVVKMTGMTGTAGEGSKIAMAQPYKVTKRASPTLTITNATAVNYNVFRPGIETTITSPSVVNNIGDADVFSIELGTFSGLVNNDSWTGRYSTGTFLASAEL
jgi:hypothetical protein